MCHFDTAEHGGGRRVCSETGNLPACALCPRSPTYWQNTATPKVADPWNGDTGTPAREVDMTGWRDDRTPVDLAVMLCVLCDIPTTWITPKGKRCHPSCATMWARTHALPMPSPHGSTTRA